jgi:hypothetical protein
VCLCSFNNEIVQGLLFLPATASVQHGTHTWVARARTNMRIPTLTCLLVGKNQSHGERCPCCETNRWKGPNHTEPLRHLIRHTSIQPLAGSSHSWEQCSNVLANHTCTCTDDGTTMSQGLIRSVDGLTDQPTEAKWPCPTLAVKLRRQELARDW